MRYDNWDVIIFPRDSHIPIQEFKTACYTSQDQYGRQIPTLTSFIASLPVCNPFRVSVHSWATAPKPSALIESQRKKAQRVVYCVQILLDGSRVFHGLFDVSSRWPLEIVNEKRSAGFIDLQSSQRKSCLEFPPFSHNVLMRSSWEARDNIGRIKVVLSEQLVNKTHSPAELDLGTSNDIICFSFQHAPREILEQAGISWPIRNPLYLPSTSRLRGFTPQATFPYVKARNPTVEAKIHSPLSFPSGYSFPRPLNPELHPRPKTDPPPQFLQFPVPPTGERDNAKTFTWDDAFDDVSMLDSWSTQRTSSNSTGDITMTDLMHASPPRSKPRPLWDNSGTHDRHETNKSWDEGRQRQDRRERQVVVTLRDDQLGQIIEAISPPKERHCEPSVQQHSHGHARQFPGNTQAYPPKTNTPITTRPSAAALSRKASYPDFHPHSQNISKKQSPEKDLFHETEKSPAMRHPSFASGKENRPPSQGQDVRLPTAYPFANRVPTPHPFVPSGPKSGIWESDVSMRDPSSVFSSVMLDKASQQRMREKSSPAPVPLAEGSVKSRKEGLISNSLAPVESTTRHDKSLLPDAVLIQAHEQVPHNTPVADEVYTPVQSTINPGAIEATLFVPGHNSGVSSIDSTGRLERKLFSALGEELNSFNENTDPLTNEAMASDLDFNSPVVKRKRQGTFGAERGRSPMAKMAKDVEGPDKTPEVCMRGG